MPVFHDTFAAMGTRFDLVIPEASPEEGRPCGGAIRSEVSRLERKLSRFDAESLLNTLNREAGVRPVRVDEEMVRILTLCLAYFDSTRGAFDITLSPLGALWRERASGRDPSPPTPREVASVKEGTGMDKVEIDGGARTVRFHHPELAIDLGGFGKGYALERVNGILEENGMDDAFVCFGDSAVLGRGRHPHGTHWEVGVKHLFDPTRSVCSFKLFDQSLSTSGTTPNNRPSTVPWYGHIIDPRSGMPVVGHRTLSVVSSSALDAEVLSTALSSTPPGERDGILKAFDDIQAAEFEYAGSHEPEPTWSAGQAGL